MLLLLWVVWTYPQADWFHGCQWVLIKEIILQRLREIFPLQLEPWLLMFALPVSLLFVHQLFASGGTMSCHDIILELYGCLKYSSTPSHPSSLMRVTPCHGFIAHGCLGIVWLQMWLQFCHPFKVMVSCQNKVFSGELRLCLHIPWRVPVSLASIGLSPSLGLALWSELFVVSMKIQAVDIPEVSRNYYQRYSGSGGRYILTASWILGELTWHVTPLILRNTALDV